VSRGNQHVAPGSAQRLSYRRWSCAPVVLPSGPGTDPLSPGFVRDVSPWWKLLNLSGLRAIQSGLDPARPALGNCGLVEAAGVEPVPRCLRDRWRPLLYRSLLLIPKVLSQPKLECQCFTRFVEHMRAQLGIEALLEHAPTDDPLPGKKLYVGTVARTVA